MALPTPALDDRSFQDLVDEAKRLIPTYCPEWTNHNLSDPGVALIEIFAWMTEIFLYRLNQVPDRFYSLFLSLVGVEPFAATPAGADLTFWLSSTEAGDVTIPAGTEVATDRTAGEPTVFMTDRPVTVRQPELVAMLVSDSAGRLSDEWDDLRYDRAAVTCFPSDPVAAGEAFYLGFESPLAGNVLRLDVAATVIGVGVEPKRPPLRWEVSGQDTWLECIIHDDSTGGLNRDGSITLIVPPVHDSLTIGERSQYWVRCVLVEPEVGQPPYKASPAIRDLRAVSLGGTVRAHHGSEASAEIVGVSDGTPGQVFVCPHTPLHPRMPGQHVTTTTDVEEVEWFEVDDFAASGPADRHLRWNSSTGEVTFGPAVRYPDGSVVQHGAIPPKGSEIRLPAHRYGGGSSGNLGARTLTNLRSTISFVDRVENLAAATGGVDSETVDDVKRRGPITLRSGDRAVTAEDYERATLDSAAGIARARCLPPAEPGGPIRLLLVPRTTKRPEQLTLDDFALDDAVVSQVADHLEPRRVLGTTVEIGTPYYQGVTIAALVTALPGRPAEVVRQRVRDVLYRYVDPSVGGRRGFGWEFDTDLLASDVYQLVGAVDGVERVDEVLFFEADVRNEDRIGGGREILRLDPESLFLSFRHRVVVR